jgi:hypothetical protein
MNASFSSCNGKREESSMRCSVFRSLLSSHRLWCTGTLLPSDRKTLHIPLVISDFRYYRFIKYYNVYEMVSLKSNVFIWNPCSGDNSSGAELRIIHVTSQVVGPLINKWCAEKIDLWVFLLEQFRIPRKTDIVPINSQLHKQARHKL